MSASDAEQSGNQPDSAGIAMPSLQQALHDAAEVERALGISMTEEQVAQRIGRLVEDNPGGSERMYPIVAEEAER